MPLLADVFGLNKVSNDFGEKTSSARPYLQVFLECLLIHIIINSTELQLTYLESLQVLGDDGDSLHSALKYYYTILNKKSCSL